MAAFRQKIPDAVSADIAKAVGKEARYFRTSAIKALWQFLFAIT